MSIEDEIQRIKRKLEATKKEVKISSDHLLIDYIRQLKQEIDGLDNKKAVIQEVITDKSLAP